MITNINQLDLNGTYTYADYLTWKFKERLEIFKGKIFSMSPAPSTFHQRISLRLTAKFLDLLNEKPCNLFIAPFDVRLIDKKKSLKNHDIYTVVQPDLCVICDDNKIDERGCIGAPDLIIEILSPGNSNKEMKHKFDLYEEAGVLEYWIVNPADKNILIYQLRKGIFIGLHPLIAEDNIKSPLFPELDFKLEEIFV